MPDEFISPRFTGDRFAEHTLPFDVARDLVAYEELVLALAKYLYKEKHQDRKRVVRGFAKGFHLHLTKTEDGSTIPKIVLAPTAALLACLPIEITEARDLINEVIACENKESLPSEFPKEFYPFFDRIGRSLQDGEAIEWRPESPDKKAILTPEKRKRLALAHQETYEANIHLVGLIESLDREKLRCRIKTVDGVSVSFSFSKQFFPELSSALSNTAAFAYIEGVGEYDVRDQLQTITEIETIEIIPHYPLVDRLDKLQKLKDGWLNGEGVAPAPADLDTLSEQLAEHFPNGLAYPEVGLSDEGNVILEWIRPNVRAELEVNFPDRQLELYSTVFDPEDFLEEIVPLDEPDCWARLFASIKHRLAHA
jgi:hypothetical protein